MVLSMALMLMVNLILENLCSSKFKKFNANALQEKMFILPCLHSQRATLIGVAFGGLITLKEYSLSILAFISH